MLLDPEYSTSYFDCLTDTNSIGLKIFWDFLGITSVDCQVLGVCMPNAAMRLLSSQAGIGREHSWQWLQALHVLCAGSEL